jgi:hypothetical protein
LLTTIVYLHVVVDEQEELGALFDLERRQQMGAGATA